MISNGATSMLLERLKESSDEFIDVICQECGASAIIRPQQKTIKCPMDDSHSNFGRKSLPYINCLLQRYLSVAGIGVKFTTEPLDK